MSRGHAVCEAKQAKGPFMRGGPEKGSEFTQGCRVGLYSAAASGDEYLVRAALDSGADPNECVWGRSALTIAVRSGHKKIARMIAEAGGPEMIRREENAEALCYAACVEGEAHDSLLALLLGLGPDLNAVDDEGTPLAYYAAANDCPRNLKLLLAAGADPEARVMSEVFSEFAEEEYGTTLSLLDIARHLGSSECEAILEARIQAKRAREEAGEIEKAAAAPIAEPKRAASL